MTHVPPPPKQDIESKWEVQLMLRLLNSSCNKHQKQVDLGSHKYHPAHSATLPAGIPTKLCTEAINGTSGLSVLISRIQQETKSLPYPLPHSYRWLFMALTGSFKWVYTGFISQQILNNDILPRAENLVGTPEDMSACSYIPFKTSSLFGTYNF